MSDSSFLELDLLVQHLVLLADLAHQVPKDGELSLKVRLDRVDLTKLDEDVLDHV